MKVLIVKLSAFGDIIHSLPALDDLLARPEIDEVHWLVDARYDFVTKIFPERVKVHSIALKGDTPLRAVMATVKKLRREQFEMAFDLQGLMKSAVLARLICNKVYGLDQRFIREKPAAWLQYSAPLAGDEKHVVQQYRNVVQAPWLELLGQIESTYQAPKIYHHIHRDEHVFDFMNDQPMLVLNLGGAWATKVLPDRTWFDIAEGATDKGYQVVWCWGNQVEYDKALFLNVAGIVLEKRLDIYELSVLLRQAFYVVAADTGVLHLASALGTPTISYWGPSASWRSAPLSATDIQIESKPSCGPCFKRQCGDFICMDMIQAQDIIDQL